MSTCLSLNTAQSWGSLPCTFRMHRQQTAAQVMRQAMRKKVSISPQRAVHIYQYSGWKPHIRKHAAMAGRPFL